MTGGLIQLVSYGAQDIYLTGIIENVINVVLLEFFTG